MKKMAFFRWFMGGILIVNSLLPCTALAEEIINENNGNQTEVSTESTPPSSSVEGSLNSVTNAVPSSSVQQPTENSSKTTKKTLTLSLENDGQTLETGVVFFLKISGTISEGTITLPQGMLYDEPKNSSEKNEQTIKYDKETRKLTINSKDKKELKVPLKVEKAGDYQLQLKDKEDALVSNVLKVTVVDKNNTLKKAPLQSGLEATAQDSRVSLEVNSDPTSSFTETDNRILYTARLTHTNALDQINNGKIVFTLENGTFNATTDTPENNSEVKSFTVSADKKTVTFLLNDGISSGNYSNISITVIPDIGLSKGDNITAQVSFSGNFASETDEFNNTVSRSVVYDIGAEGAVVPVEPNSPAWTLNSLKDIVAYPEQLIGQFLTLRRNTAISPKQGFTNLKVRVVASDAAVFEQNMLEGFNASYERDKVGGGKEYVTFDREKDVKYIQPNICEVTIGTLNPNVYNDIIIKNGFRFPKGTPEGTTYKWHTEFYDGDTLIYQTNEATAVADKEGTKLSGIVYNNSVQKSSIQSDELKSVSLKYSLSSSSATTNIQAVFNIPQQVDVQYAQPIYSEAANSVNYVKKVEYLVNGNWTEAPYDQVYNFPTGSHIDKVRVTFKDAKSFSTLQPFRLFFRGKKDLQVDDTFRVNLESFTYTDAVGEDQSLPVNTYYTEYTVTDEEKTSLAAAYQVNKTKDFDSGVAIPGDQFQMSYRIGAQAGSIEEPYIFVKVPKGLEVTNNANVIQYPFGGYVEYPQAPANGQDVYPINKANNVGKFEMSDGKYEVYYYKADDTTLEKVDSLSMLLINNTYTVKQLNAGVYDIQVGMGSLTKEPTQASLRTGFTTDKLSAELKNKLGATNTTFYSKTTRLTVGSLDKVTTSVSVKGSEDSDWIDASSGGIGSVIPGKKVSYKVELKNEGTEEYTDVQLINILPYVNDTLVSSNAPRNSKFQINPSADGFKVKYNNVESTDVVTEYSTSNTPQRFSSPTGAVIPGDSWTSTPGDISKVRSLKVSLPGVVLRPNETITIEYSGVVVTDANRPTAPDELITANNSVAYSFKTQNGDIRAGEPAVSKVKTVPAANDGSITGNAFVDLNENGSQDANEVGLNKVRFELYKRNDSNEFVATNQTAESASNSNGSTGTFSFVDLEYGTYRVKVFTPEVSGARLVTTGPYGINKIDDTSGWVTLNGSTDFTLSDISASSNTVDLKVPIFSYTPLSGKVIFKDKNGVVLNRNYGKDFTVVLKDSNNKEVTHTTVDENSFYEFTNLSIDAEGTYKLEFTAPDNKHFAFTDDNPEGRITTQLVPGIGTTGTTDVYITDVDQPTGSIQLVGGDGPDHNVNPTQINISANDATTEATIAWEIKDENNQVVYSGNSAEIKDQLDYLLSDERYGAYTLNAVITDAAGNTNAAPVTKNFVITKAPTLTIANKQLTYRTVDQVTEATVLADMNATASTVAPNRSVTITTNFADVIADSKVATEGAVITVTATDAYGLTTTEQVTVVINDTTVPVTFVNEGQETTVDGIYNHLLSQPASINTQKAGYRFNGWLKADGQTIWNFETDKVPAEALRLTASYSALDQTITFDVNGGDASSKPADIVQPTDSNVDLATVSEPTRPGYTFVGWYQGETKVAGTITMPAGGLNLVAHWTADDQTITFDVNGGDETSKPANIVQPTDSQVNIDAVAKPTKTGYTFVNWVNKANNEVVSGTIAMPVGGLELKATWTAQAQVLSFDTAGGTGIPSVETTTDATFDLSTVHTTRAGYEFAGWYKDGQEYSGVITIPVGGLTLQAKWTALDQVITFDVNGGDETSKPADIVEPTDSDVNLDDVAAPTRAGYEFIGWYNGNEKVDGIIQMPAGGLALVAHWSALEQTIMFDVNGGDPATKPAAIQAVTDSTIDMTAIATPEREAFEFIGWADASGNLVGDEYTVPAGGAVLQAQWKDLILSGDWILEGNQVELSVAEYKKLAAAGQLEATLRQLADAKIVDVHTQEQVMDSGRIELDLGNVAEKAGTYTITLSYVPKTYEEEVPVLRAFAATSLAKTTSSLTKEINLVLTEETPVVPVVPEQPTADTPIKISSKDDPKKNVPATKNTSVSSNKKLLNTGVKQNPVYYVAGILVVLIAGGLFYSRRRKK